LTADTSAVIAALSAWHEQHRAAARALHAVTAVPAHVAVEAYAVLTRLPSGLAVPAATAAEVLAERFPDAPQRLSAADRRALLRTLSAAGIVGGATYDGVVALEAQSHDEPLLTVDRRAQDTYRRLAVAFEPI
jgi:toxin FitB